MNRFHLTLDELIAAIFVAVTIVLAFVPSGGLR